MKQKSEFKNDSANIFIDIDSEQWREYWFPRNERVYVSGQSGYTDIIKIRIYGPLKLAISDSGGHRIWDDAGVSHYIPSGWVHLSWEVKDGFPHFVK